MMSVARIARPVSAYRALPRKKQQGFAIAAVMLIFIIMGGIVYMGAATAGRTIKTAVYARDFTESGQLADYAVQDALYTLNEQLQATPSLVLPTLATPKTGSSTNGTWQWYADPLDRTKDPSSASTADPTEPLGVGGGWSLTIHASGNFRGDTRNVTAVAGSLKAGGFKVLADNRLSYEEGPAAAWTHTIMGRSVKVQNGTGLGAGTTFLSGDVAVTGAGPLDLSTYPGLASKVSPTSRTLLYGGQAAALNVDGATKIPSGISLDSQFVADNLARCGTAIPEDWVASRAGGVLVANGNSACYNSMTFDVPVTVLGAGSFNGFVKGDVTFKDSVTAPASALNIYTNGAVTFNTPAASGTSMTLQKTFIFAPKGACTTSPFRDLTKVLNFTGSMACDSVSVAGKFNWVPAVSPLGSDLYAREIWFLTDYHQPAGARN